MRLFASLLALTASLLVTVPSQASEKELIQFLQTMDGLWRGSGVYRATQWNGSRVETGYTLSSEYFPEANQVWLVKNHVRTNSGFITTNQYRLRVLGDSLYIGNPTALELVTVVHSMADALTYRLIRVDSTTLPSKIYTYTYEYRVRANRAGDRVLLGRATVESNGVLVADDQNTLDQF